MKKFLVFMLIAVLVTLTGCAQLINTEYKEVDVKITDKYHRAAYVTPIRAGKVTSMVTHPAVYRIRVEYDGNEYILNGSTVYNQYKNKIGQTVNGRLKIDTYDDGTIRYNVVEIWEKYI